MTTPVSSLPNLGPATDAVYEKVGIRNAETLRKLGADASYAKLLASGYRPHFIAYYALVMGLQGRKWTDCKGAEKDALRVKFDSLVAQSKPDEHGIEKMLDQIGVPRPK
ncbi:MAG: TfoX/Sxy family protein [Maritimibacter sp.]